MCNLYKTRKSVEEIARLFNADIAPDLFGVNLAEEVFPGTPGLVVREGEAGRVLERMTWGWPLVTRDMKERAARTGKDPRPKPVNNARELTSGFWRSAAMQPARRCLIPVETFAEAEGPKGGKTRTWFSVGGEPMFAWAGLWRPSVEWGAVYAGVMTEANCLVEPVHDRMPVILGDGDHDRWLRGSFDDLLALQQPCPAERLVMQRTNDPWNSPRSAA